jgi:hypothetical protein
MVQRVYDNNRRAIREVEGGDEPEAPVGAIA